MGVRILKREYTNQFKQPSTTTWLLGNVGDWQKMTLEVEFKVEILFSISNPLTITDPNILTLTGGGNWGDFGFAAGQTVTLEFVYEDLTNGSIFVNQRFFTISLISGPDLEASNILGTSNGNPISTSPLSSWNFPLGQTMPYHDSNSDVREVRVYADAQPEGVKIDYAHTTNSNAPSGNLANDLDGSITSFQAEETNDPLIYPFGVPTPFTHILSYQSGLSVISSNLTYLGSQDIAYTYRIELIFMLSPFYEDINNLITEVAPSSVNGAEALTDNFLVTGFPVYNNPNVRIQNDPKRTEQEGNTGWFNENFNQLPNPYSRSPVVYTNLSGTVVNQLDYANPIVMTTTISDINNSFVDGVNQFQYGFIWTSINEDDWKEVSFVDTAGQTVSPPYHENLKVSTGGQAANLNDVFPLSPLINSVFPLLRTGYSADGASMDASDISFVLNGNDVDVTITFRPNTAFAAFMDAQSEENRQYALWISVGDQAPPTNLGDRVSLLLDFNNLVTFVEPIGPWEPMTISFTDHPQVYTDTPIPCGNSIYVEDDLLAKIEFTIDTDVADDIRIPQAIAFGFVVENSTTGQQYVLDNNFVDLTQYPGPTQYNFDQSRGFKLGVGNDKNWFKVDYDGSGGGTLEDVIGWYGYKIRWEDWIARFDGVPNDFYDNTELKNGKNNDWFHYFDTLGWNFYFSVKITALLDGETVVYQNLKEITILDYDSNGTITTTLEYYRDNAGVKGALLNGGTDPVTGAPLGVIVDGEKVWLDITYTSSVVVPDWANQVTVDANVYATQCIEVDQGAGQFEFRQLSSVHLPEVDNPMIPLPGDTLATITYVSSTEIIVSTRIDASLLINSNRYKITGREGCK